uniref:Myb_Cef domain-containing protein n=1 Tax=Glossina brevipalpis TaxID=37001 RepID=A0A1A9X0Y5_9MUSC
KHSLRERLSSLPTPKNDYEIVVPEENEIDPAESTNEISSVEDQADVDARVIAEKEIARKQELEKRSQVVQRTLPRPTEVNTKILRPLSDKPNLTELQNAEEMIKHEMITMLLYDSTKDPVPGQSENKMDQLQTYFKSNPYEEISKEELNKAKLLLSNEMRVVKDGMGHGDLALDVYSQVWEECLAQVLFLPSQNRYTRANLASKKDRFESAEKRLEQNRRHMAKEAKRCGKIEKKLKILTGGYQARAQALIKQLQDTFEQIEQNTLALSTFKFLAEQEAVAIPRRLESLQEDVRRQMEREKKLQQKYANLQENLKELSKDETK